MKHKLIYIFIFVGIIDACLIMLIVRNKMLLQQKPQNTVRIDPALTVPTPEWTGGSNEPFVLTDVDKQMSALLDNVPFQNTSFAISMDYKRNIFIVTIKDPYEANVKQFKTWLKDNQYNLVSETKFQYVRAFH